MMWNQRHRSQLPMTWMVLIGLMTMVLLSSNGRRLLRRGLTKGTAMAIDYTGRLRMDQQSRERKKQPDTTETERKNIEIPIRRESYE